LPGAAQDGGAGHARSGRGRLPGRRPGAAPGRPYRTKGPVPRPRPPARRSVRVPVRQRPAPARRPSGGGPLMSALRRWWLPIACAALVLGGVLLFVVYVKRRPQVRVGSKAFPESIILGEMVRLLAQDAGKRVGHSKSLGDTSKPWNALLVGDIDVY